MITVETEYYNPISQDFFDNTIYSIDLAMLPCTCGHSHALLLSSVVLYSQISLRVQASIARSYEDSSGYQDILASQTLIDENTISCGLSSQTDGMPVILEKGAGYILHLFSVRLF